MRPGVETTAPKLLRFRDSGHALAHIDAGTELLLGRGVEGAGWVGDDPGVSRRHARIAHDAQGRLIVEDLGSANGTFVNGSRLMGPQVADVGDTIRLGGTELIVASGAGGERLGDTLGREPAGRSRDAAPRAGRRPHRLVLNLLIVLAGLCLFAGSFAVWADRQVVDTGGWVSTSSRLLANRTVRNEISTYIVRRLLASGGRTGTFAGQLSGVLGSSGLEQTASTEASSLLAQPAAQRAWRESNRAAQLQALAILEGNSGTVSENGSAVVLDLSPLVGDLAKRLGSSSLGASGVVALDQLLGAGAQAGSQQLLESVAPGSGRLVILSSSQLQNARGAVNGVRDLWLALPLAAFLCMTLALALSRGWRWVALRSVGWCLVATGLAVLVARQLLGSQVIDGLVADYSARPAADAAWAIASSLLRNLAFAWVVLGVACATASLVATWSARLRSSRSFGVSR